MELNSRCLGSQTDALSNLANDQFDGSTVVKFVTYAFCLQFESKGTKPIKDLLNKEAKANGQGKS